MNDEPFDPDFIRGQIAANMGKDRTAIPYSPSSPEGRAWINGWDVKKWEHEKESGRARRRTTEMTAKARADIIADRGNDHDPAQAILDSVHDPNDPWYCGEPKPKRLSSLGECLRAAGIRFHTIQRSAPRTYDPGPDPFDQIRFYVDIDFSRMVSAFDQVAKTFDGIMKSIVTDERTRHRYMAECPVHGETRGGQCRPCQRHAMKIEARRARGRSSQWGKRSSTSTRKSSGGKGSSKKPTASSSTRAASR